MKKLSLPLMLAASFIAYPALGQSLISGLPGSFAYQMPTNIDNSILSISGATAAQVPMAAPYGDQGLTINNWDFNGATSNPSFQNIDTLRVIGINPGGSPRQTNGISSYVLSNAANCGGCADGQTTVFHGVGVANGNGTALWGFNSNLADSINVAGYAGASRYLDNEFDINVGGAQTIATWLSLGGVLLTSPQYAAGLTASFIGPGKISEFLYGWDGCCDVGLHLGLFGKQQGPNGGSQPIKMDWTDSVGNKNNLTFTAFNNTMVLGTSDQATAGAAYATQQGAGIYATVKAGSCKLKISGGIIIGTEGSC